MADAFHTDASARPAWLPSGPREDYIPPRPYRRNEAKEHVMTKTVFNEGRLPDRILRAVQSGILDVADLIRAVRAEASVVRSMLSRMEKSGELCLKRDGKGMAVQIIVDHGKVQVPTQTSEHPQKTDEVKELAVQTDSVVRDNPAPVPQSGADPKPELASKSTACQDMRQGTQADRILMAVKLHNAHTLTEIAHATGLTRDQTSKMMSFLVARSQLRDLPIRYGERCVTVVDCAEKSTSSQANDLSVGEAQPQGQSQTDEDPRETQPPVDSIQNAPDAEAVTAIPQAPTETQPPDRALEAVIYGTLQDAEQSIQMMRLAIDHMESVKARLPAMQQLIDESRQSREAIEALEKIRKVIGGV